MQGSLFCENKILFVQNHEQGGAIKNITISCTIRVVDKHKDRLRDELSKILEEPLFNTLREVEENLKSKNETRKYDIYLDELRAILKHDTQTKTHMPDIPKDAVAYLKQ